MTETGGTKKRSYAEMMAQGSPKDDGTGNCKVRDYLTFYPDDLILRFPPSSDVNSCACRVKVTPVPFPPGPRQLLAGDCPESERRILDGRERYLNELLEEGLVHISADRRGLPQPHVQQQPLEYPQSRITFGGPMSRCFDVPDPFGPNAPDQDSPLNQQVQLHRKMMRLTRQCMLSLQVLLRRYYNLGYHAASGLAQEAMDELMKLVEMHAVLTAIPRSTQH